MRRSCTKDKNAPRPVDAHDGQIAVAPASTVAIFNTRPVGSLITGGASCLRDN